MWISTVADVVHPPDSYPGENGIQQALSGCQNRPYLLFIPDFRG